MDARDIATKPPPINEDPEYMGPEATPKVRTIENTATLLEHRMVETLLDIMENGTERGRLKASDDTADILGKKSKSQVLITDNINVQNNNFLSHFKKQAQIGAPNDPTKDMPTPISGDAVDAQYDYESDLGDGEG